MLARERPGLLHEPRQTAPRVDHARSDDGAGRAAVEAAPARPTAVGRRLGGHREGRVRDDCTQDEPRPRIGQQQVGVLAEPAEAGAVRGKIAVSVR